MSDTRTIALVGNPNSGKTTLFNELTGAHQKVGNWPGVTVERKFGALHLADGEQVTLVDLPGIYSLEQEFQGIDEDIAGSFLAQDSVDVVINIVDASHLDRQLLLTEQLLDLQLPMILAVNMLDVAENQGINIDLKALSQRLKIPVVGLIAAKGVGLEELKTSLQTLSPAPEPSQNLPESLTERTLFRIQKIRGITSDVVQVIPVKSPLTERIDNVVLHRLLGIPIFLLFMYLMFTFAINVGAVFIDFFDILFGAFLVDGGHWLLAQVNAPAWLATILADGFGGGIRLVATFIPVIGCLYLALSVLESTGYMARAAFVIDRVMHGIGLPGNAFVPLIVGFGCNVPAVMATRSLSHSQDRMVTIAMSPFMSCGAKLTVYALFAAALFPHQGQNLVFFLYLLGILMAVLTGWIFRKALFDGDKTPSVMEMPTYHLPTIKNIFITSWHRLRSFIVRAGKTIVAVVVVLSFLNSIGTDGSFGNEGSEQSMLSEIGRALTPALAPMGVAEDNWPATVGVFTGIFAKEAVVGTLDALYSDAAGIKAADISQFDLLQSIEDAFVSVWDNTLALLDGLSDPLGISITEYDALEDAAQEQDVRVATLSAMASLFASPFAAFCYLVFILLYTPCVAVIAAMVREAGGRWAILVVSWSTVLAYATATIIYQLGTLAEHPLSSLLWVVGMLLMMVLMIGILKWAGQSEAQTDPTRIPVIQL
jgi:ferrous iron transport protein B